MKTRVFKRDLHDLAVSGGQPAFPQPVYVGTPNIGNREHLFRKIESALSRRWLSNNGPLAQELEAQICDFLGVKHCILTCNGTVALEIASRALDLTGEVIVPSFTFIATAHALSWLGISPVFCDVDHDSHNIDPSLVEHLITPRTTGILAVHLWGRPCAIEMLTEIGQRHNLKVLFDAAHAFACSHQKRMIGNFGNLEVFSFHATKFFHTFEGGAITTNDDVLAARARKMVNFGFAGPDQVACVGTNGKMSEISAAMGLTGLHTIHEVIAINYEHYKRYEAALDSLPGLTMVRFEEGEEGNYQYIVLEVDDSKAQISRDLLIQVLRAENVIARRYFHPGCHQSEPYKSRFADPGGLPVTERLANSLLTLPNGTGLGHEDVESISEVITLAILHGSEISNLLGGTVRSKWA